MYLRKLALTSVFGAALILPAAANAQWGGFYVEGGVGPRATTTQVESTDAAGPTVVKLDAGKTNFMGSLGAGWRQDVGGWVWGVGAFWNPAGTNAGEFTVSDPAFSASGKIEQKNHWGLGGEIGWNPVPSTLIYGRLAWHMAKFNAVSAGAPTIGSTHNGFGYGLGARYLLNPNLYLFVEWQQVEFGSKTTAIGPGETLKLTPSNTIGLIGAGWKF
jgi:opacity protein-like surface antigen